MNISKKDDSNWFPWLHLLKIDEQAKEFFNMQMKIFDCVEDSTLGQALTARYQQLQEEYHQVKNEDNSAKDNNS